MANVRYAAHIYDIRGSIQNLTHSRNRPGGFLRERVVPRDPQSLLQLYQRGTHAAMVDYWRSTLTNAQRIVWNDLALATTFRSPTCAAYHPSGFSLFLRANVYRVSIGEAVAPVPDSVAAAAPPTFTFGSGAQPGETYITADGDWHDGKTGKFTLAHSYELSQSIYYWRGKVLARASFNIADLAALPLLVGIGYPITAGSRFWIRAKAYYGTLGTIITWPQHAYWDRNA